jgi:1-deoxy-D-xylulose-5-phosphate reductoisomerase
MRTPIAYALAWPERMNTPVESLDLAKVASLSFFEPDTEKFPALRLAREALEAGGQAPCVMQADRQARDTANEHIVNL